MKILSTTCSLLMLIAAQGFALEPSPTVAPPPDAGPTTPPAPAAAAKPATELFSLDYDEARGVFTLPGTTKLFSGPVVAHYDGGAKESEGTLKDGKEEGLWIEYHENGKKAQEGNYVAGQEDGPWKYWFENGLLDTAGTFRIGSPVGRWVKYFDNGKPDSEGTYVDGLMDGEWTFYDQATEQARTIKFDHGTQLTP